MGFLLHERGLRGSHGRGCNSPCQCWCPVRCDSHDDDGLGSLTLTMVDGCHMLDGWPFCLPQGLSDDGRWGSRRGQPEDWVFLLHRRAAPVCGGLPSCREGLGYLPMAKPVALRAFAWPLPVTQGEGGSRIRGHARLSGLPLGCARHFRGKLVCYFWALWETRLLLFWRGAAVLLF